MELKLFHDSGHWMETVRKNQQRRSWQRGVCPDENESLAGRGEEDDGLKGVGTRTVDVVLEVIAECEPVGESKHRPTG